MLITYLTPPPHDRPIRVRTRRDELWLDVVWRGDKFVAGDEIGSWVEPGDVEAWRERPHPAIAPGNQISD